MPERALVVEQTGPQLLVQDHGRPGHAALGVPRSGALDRPALDLGNRLVGNPPGSAGLECLLGRQVLRASGSCTIAVTGASAAVRVAGRAVPWGTAVGVADGAVVELGPALVGLRCYLAVSGGIDVPPVLGSRATDVLSGLGPAPLAAGDVLPIGKDHGPPGAVEAVPTPVGHTLRLRLGPRADWFTSSSVAGLGTTPYVVGAASNRIGLRLDLSDASRDGLERARDEELASEGMVLGGVQVTPSGQLVVFLADHPTTGGYPVVGVVVGEDLASCAQLRPGDEVRLRTVS